MKRLKLLYGLWAVFLVVIIGLITTLGFLYKKKLEPYKIAEKKLINYSQKYVELNFSYPEEGSIKIYLKDLKKANIIKELKVKNKKCDGYVVVTKKDVYQYKAYLKCASYKTKGY